MVITLFTDPAHVTTPLMDKPVYRSLCAADVTVSDQPASNMDTGDLAGKQVLAARVEYIECHLVTHAQASLEEVDATCRRVLHRQLEMKGDKDVGALADTPLQRKAALALKELDECKFYCPLGHGPHAHDFICPTCGDMCDCTTSS